MADAKKPARRPSTAERLGTAIRRAAADAAERPESTYDVKRGELASHSRRNFLLFGAGALATAVTGWWVLPERTKQAWLPESTYYVKRGELASHSRRNFLLF